MVDALESQNTSCIRSGIGPKHRNITREQSGAPLNTGDNSTATGTQGTILSMLSDNECTVIKPNNTQLRNTSKDSYSRYGTGTRPKNEHSKSKLTIQTRHRNGGDNSESKKIKNPESKRFNTSTDNFYQCDSIPCYTRKHSGGISPQTSTHETRLDIRSDGPKYANPDNIFQNLEDGDPSSSLHKHTSSDLSYASDNKTVITTPSSSTTIRSAVNKAYNKMTLILTPAQTSVHSLTPSLSNLTLKGQVADKYEKNKTGYMNKNSLRYQSDNSDDDGDNEADEVTNIDTPAAWSVLNTVEDNNSKKNRDNILKDINDFQSNFVEKFNQNIPSQLGDTIPKNISRTQQKILDYKELHDFPLPDLLSSDLKQHTLQDSPYSYKIQYENINSEYTLIKLRFSSEVAGTPSDTTSISEEERKREPQLISRMGVLGFIDRSRFFNYQNLPKDSTPEEPNKITNELSDKHPVISENNKEQILSDIWNDELKAMFSTCDSVPSTSINNETHRRSIEDGDIYKNAYDNNGTGAISIDISKIARNVRFKSYTS